MPGKHPSATPASAGRFALVRRLLPTVLEEATPVIMPHSTLLSESALADDVVLPAQLLRRRQALPEPERRLRLAILEDALRYYRDYAGSTDPRRRALHDDAAEWLASRDRLEPFAFENVCEALGLEPDAVRRALARERARRVERKVVGERRAA